MSNIYDHVSPEIKEILKKVEKNEDLTQDDAVNLLKVTGRDFIALQYIADQVCLEKKENLVTFVINRNINFTNICYQGCKFCSFSVTNRNKDSFLLSLNEIEQKTKEAKKLDCTEVCIQGGINPDLKFDYYLDILKTVKKVDAQIHIHAFSPQEVYFMSNLYGTTVEETLIELKKSGLDSIPGTAAEILVDDIRKIICPNKINTNKWIEMISLAHKLGIPTTSTMMYGHVEGLKDRVAHLEVLRAIQEETRGFTEFVPLPFVKEKPILSKLTDSPLKASYGMDDLKLFCVARLYFNNLIENVQCSWVKLGVKFAQISLNYGVNDFSGTLMEENISKSAGAEFGEYLDPEEIISIIKTAGKKPAQRDTLYKILKIY